MIIVSVQVRAASLNTMKMVRQQHHRIVYVENIHEIQIDQLLLVKIASRNVLQDVREQGRDVLAQRHGHDGLLDRLLSLVRILRDQTRPQLKRLSLPRRGKSAPDAIHRHRRGALGFVGGARGVSWIRRRDATSREGSVHRRCRGGSCSGGRKGLMALRLRLPEEPRVAALRIVASWPGKLSFRGGCELQAYGLGHGHANIRTATA